MFAPNQTHFMVADVRHAERLADADRLQLAAELLQPQAGTPHVTAHRGRITAAVASVVLALAVAAGVAASVGSSAAGPAAPDAGSGGNGGGGVTYIR